MDNELASNPAELTSLPGVTAKESGSNHHPPDYRREITLLDGSKATIRPMLCDDRNALVGFHSRLSEDTRFLRYHYFKGDLTDSDLKNLCDIDYSDVLALIAEKEHNGRKEIIGVGRYIRLPYDHIAEVAFVVQDNEQQKSIGTQLLRHLAVLAWQRDIHYFIAEVLRQNGRMLSIFRKADPRMEQEIDSPSTCTITLSVTEILNGKPITYDTIVCPLKR